MEVDTDEHTDRWGKPSTNSDENNKTTPGKDKKKSKRKKKRKSHSKKSKSSKENKKHDRWRPVDSDDNDDNDKPIKNKKKKSKKKKKHKNKNKIKHKSPLSSSSSSPLSSPSNSKIKIKIKSKSKSISKSHSRSNSPDDYIHGSQSNSSHHSLHSRSGPGSGSGSRSRSRSRSRSKDQENDTKKDRIRYYSKDRERHRSRDRDRDRDRGDRGRHRSRDRSRDRTNRFPDTHDNRDRDRDRDRDKDRDRDRYDDYSFDRRHHRPSSHRKKLDQLQAALNTIKEKHKDDNTHPLDLKQSLLNRNRANARDKAMIWSVATCHYSTEIINGSQFQKSINLSLKALINNKSFDIASLFKQFANYSVKLQWLDCSKNDIGINKSELLTFKDLMSIKSFRKELNHCDKLWKFIFYDQRNLFWSMAIYYSLIKTTLVKEWDDMFKKQYYLIKKYGKHDYINKDVELIEDRLKNKY